MVHHGFRLGVPAAGRWQERINTDSAFYGGSNVGNGSEPMVRENVGAHGRALHRSFTLGNLSMASYAFA